MATYLSIRIDFKHREIAIAQVNCGSFSFKAQTIFKTKFYGKAL